MCNLKKECKEKSDRKKNVLRKTCFGTMYICQCFYIVWHRSYQLANTTRRSTVYFRMHIFLLLLIVGNGDASLKQNLRKYFHTFLLMLASTQSQRKYPKDLLRNTKECALVSNYQITLHVTDSIGNSAMNVIMKCCIY